jgi:flagellar basal-body rod protein FlgG
MIKGLYSSEASMRPKMAQLDVIANNLANINSTGFKKDRLFVEMLKNSTAAQAKDTGELDGLDVRRTVDYSEGTLLETGNTFDLALQGRGFFVVETPQGPRFTRNGHFKLATDGSIVTEEGYAVMGTSGKIKVPRLDTVEQAKLTISESGEIALGKEVIGRLRVIDFDTLARLTKDHESFFMAQSGEKILEGPGNGVAVKQGFLEESNVEGIEEMVAMVELTRAFETDQRIIASQDASVEKSLDVGRV